MDRKEIKIGLFGYGTVGKGLFEAIQKTPTLNAKIEKICIKNPQKSRNLPSEYFTTKGELLLNDPEINTIVELIDDSDAAFEIVKKALRAGKSVVSANKKMIAEHFDELLSLQKETGSSLLYEAACCASIPIIRNLEEYYDNDLLEHIEGIVNGSTNYILTQIDQKQIPFDLALKQAQELGYAESNPVMDIGGFDAKYKLIILIGHAFGLSVHPDKITQIGIDRLGELELQFAKEKQLKIKLVAHASRLNNGEISAWVLPKFIDSNDPLFQVQDVYNGIKTKTFFSDYQFFVGKGAGAYPTASAVISDISALSYSYKYEYKKIQNVSQTKPRISKNVTLKVLIRYPKFAENEIEAFFENIDEKLTRNTEQYLIGNIQLEKIPLLESKFKRDYSLILI